MFCVIGNPRSGSTALGEAISVSTNKKQIVEPFNPKVHLWEGGISKFYTFEERLEWIKKSNAGFFKTVTHYKDYWLSHSEELINTCINNFPTLFLVRDDVFSCTLSSIIAQYTGGWNIHLVPEDYENIVSGLTIDVDKFRSQYEDNDLMIFLYKKLAIDNVNLFNRIVYYEDLFMGDISDKTFRQIEAVTGPLDRRKFIEELGRHKINGPEVLKSVKNYRDLLLCF